MVILIPNTIPRGGPTGLLPSSNPWIIILYAA